MTAKTRLSHSPRLISLAVLFMESEISLKIKVIEGGFGALNSPMVSCTLRVGRKTFDPTVQHRPECCELVLCDIISKATDAS